MARFLSLNEYKAMIDDNSEWRYLEGRSVLGEYGVPVIVIKVVLLVVQVSVVVLDQGGGAHPHLGVGVGCHLELLLLRVVKAVAKDCVQAVGNDVGEGVGGADGPWTAVGVGAEHVSG